MARLLALAALIAVASAITGCGSEERERPGRAEALAAQRAAGYPLFWVGTSFDGLALEEVLRGPVRTSFVYGTCEPSGSDTGCAPPLAIQVSSTCDANTLALAIRPEAMLRARGLVVRDYREAGRLALDAGVSYVTVSAEAARSRRAVAALRPVAGSQRLRASLPKPRYPLAYVRELRAVRDAYVRLGDVRAVRTALGISKSAVRFELGLARELGPERLRRAGAAAPPSRRGAATPAPRGECRVEPAPP